MSNIWNRADMTELARPLAGWGGFGEIGGRGDFRTIYSAGEKLDNGWVTGGFEPAGGADAPADPVEAARQEAFAAGFEEGFSAAQAEQADAIDARRRLAEALAHLKPVEAGTLSAMLSAAVLRLVGQIVGEVPVDAGLLKERCDAVAACLDSDDGRPVLRLHPDDIALLDGAVMDAELVPDPAIDRGGVRLDTAEGWIEDGPDVRLARLKALFDDMEGRA